MKRYLKSKLLRALAMFVIAGLAGAWAMGAIRDKHEVAKMTEKMKTVCVGRFLIDLPDEATVSIARPRINGFDIDTVDETDQAFWARVAARQAEIQAKPDRHGGNRNMESVSEIKGDNGLVGKILVHSRNVTEGQSSDGLTVDHYRYEGVTVEAFVHAKGISVDLSGDDIDPKYIEEMPRLVAKLVANAENRIPTEPGYCVDRAYFSDPIGADQHERITMFANLPSHPDIQIRLTMSAGRKPYPRGLLQRHADGVAKLSFDEKAQLPLMYSELRAAPRTIGTLTGDELVERFMLDRGITYDAEWEVTGTQDNVFAPQLTFEMETGKERGQAAASSLSEKAVLELWDKIVSSIRVRPTREPKLSAAEPAAPPLGSMAAAGDMCPLSGWWACSDGSEKVGVLGGQRQYILKGQRMPQALLLPAPTLWEKLRGVQRSYETTVPTLWTLADKRSRKRAAPGVPLAQALPAASGDAGARGGSNEPRVHIGTYATTGKACPASGWWRCEASHALDGTRWFAQGSLLPAATFTVPPGVLGKPTGTPKAILRRGTWVLMRLAENPEPAEDDLSNAKADVHPAS